MEYPPRYTRGNGKITKECAFCKKQFLTKMIEIRQGGGNFCGQDCYHKSRIGSKISEEHKRAIIRANTGRKLTEEGKKRISLANRGRVPPNKGKKMSVEHRMKVSEGRLKGKPRKYDLRQTLVHCQKYRNWRSEIYRRDGWRCVLCGVGGNINADHCPKTFAEIVDGMGITNLDQALRCEMLWDTSNGRTLCVPCHRRTPSYARHLSDYRKLSGNPPTASRH